METEDADPDEQYVHEIVRVDRKTGRIFKDRQTILYINSRMPEDTALGKLMHDFHCEDPDDMFCEPISKRVRMIKESTEEVEHMCKEMDRIYNDGETVGAKKEKVKTALSMIDDDFPTEVVAKHSRLTTAEVQQLQERKKKKEAAIQLA